MNLPPKRLSKLAPISDTTQQRAERMFRAWQTAANLNSSQIDLRDCLGRDFIDSERMAAEVILRARMQDAVATLLHPGCAVDNDRAIYLEMQALGFPAPVIRNAYFRAHLLGGGRSPTPAETALNLTQMWSEPVSPPDTNTPPVAL